MRREEKYLYINNSDEKTLKLILDESGDVSFEMSSKLDKFIIPRDTLIAMFFERVIDDIVNCHMFNLSDLNFSRYTEKELDAVMKKSIEKNNEAKESDMYKKVVIDNQTIEAHSIEGNTLRLSRDDENVIVEIFSECLNSDKLVNVTALEDMYPFSLCFKKLFTELDKHSKLLKIVKKPVPAYQKVYRRKNANN